MANVKEVLAELVADELGIDAREVKEDSHLTNDLGADSLDLANILMEIEETFDIHVSDEDAEAQQTINDWTRLIEQKKAA